MKFFLPVTLLIGILATTAIAWIVITIDPANADAFVFPVFVSLVFLATLVDLGLLLYLIRTKILGKRMIDRKWYLMTSFKMSFFISLFLSIVTILAILKLLNLFNVGGVGLVMTLFALWVYLGRR